RPTFAKLLTELAQLVHRDPRLVDFGHWRKLQVSDSFGFGKIRSLFAVCPTSSPFLFISSKK
ncbi:hypothetical protein TorRG33x02_310830, partial [Trema orientale]